MRASQKVPERRVGVPVIEDELRSGTPPRGAVLSGPCRIDTPERELETPHAATLEAEDRALAVRRVAEFMEGAITGGCAGEIDTKNVFRQSPSRLIRPHRSRPRRPPAQPMTCATELPVTPWLS